MKIKVRLHLILFYLTSIILFSQYSSAQLLHFKAIPQFENTLAKGFYFNQEKDSTIRVKEFHPGIKTFYYSDIKPADFDLRKKIFYNLFDKWGRNKMMDPFPNAWFTTNVNADFMARSDLYFDGRMGENTAGLNLNYFHVPQLNFDLGSRSKGFAIAMNYNFSYSNFADYEKVKIHKTHVVPGKSYAKTGLWGYQYHDLSFYTAKNAGKYFIFETGYGKNFWGDGHRSLFISDAACSYPYFKITTSIWKLKYINLWANFKDITEGYESWFHADNKYGTFHFLSWNATKKLNINFFEGVVWDGKTKNHTRNFDVNYLNPIIFFRPVEFSLGSPDNALLGVGGHYKIGKKHVLYAQILLDDFLLKEVRAGFVHYVKPGDSTLKYGSWFNKQAWQIGYKYFDVAGIKNMNFQTEFNYVRPYTYSHRVVDENYGHFNESLAHPLGANFWESVTFLRYSIHKWYFESELLYYVIGLDSNGTHFGQDIYKPTFDTYEPSVGNIVVQQYGNKVGQGLKNSVLFYRLKYSYLISAPLNLRIEGGVIYRTQKSISENKTEKFIFFGLKTTLDGRCNDF